MISKEKVTLYRRRSDELYELSRDFIDVARIRRHDFTKFLNDINAEISNLVDKELSISDIDEVEALKSLLISRNKVSLILAKFDF